MHVLDIVNKLMNSFETSINTHNNIMYYQMVDYSERACLMIFKWGKCDTHSLCQQVRDCIAKQINQEITSVS